MEEELRTIIEMSHDGIVIPDEANRVTFANKKTSELTGYRVEELMGMNFTALFINEDREVLVDILTEDEKGEKLGSCCELDILTSEGNTKETEGCITTTRVPIFEISLKGRDQKRG